MSPEITRRQFVLVVDDSPTSANTLVQTLKHNGYFSLARNSAAEAVRVCQLIAPDWIVVDVDMSEMSRVEMATKLSLMVPKSKVILVSGNTTTSKLLEESLANGTFELLAKPLNPEELLRRLRSGPVHDGSG